MSDYRISTGPMVSNPSGFALHIPVLGTAHFSDDGMYRYSLTRTLTSRFSDWPILFIMLNPSTADENADDPTIRRCISFSEKNFHSHLTVVNLFALRATDPKELLIHPDPYGPLNNEVLADMIKKHKPENIVAAWGSHKFAQTRAKEVLKKFGPMQCLGTTKDGSPRHPLYVKNSQEFEDLK